MTVILQFSCNPDAVIGAGSPSLFNGQWDIPERDPTSTKDISPEDLRHRSGLLAGLIIGPWTAFVKALEPLSRLAPELLTPRYRKCVGELEDLSRAVGVVLDKVHRDLKEIGAKWDTDKERVVLKSTGGRRPKAMTQLIVDLWKFLKSNANNGPDGRKFKGNPGHIREDVKNLLEPFIEVSKDDILHAVDNLLNPPFQG